MKNLPTGDTHPVSGSGTDHGIARQALMSLGCVASGVTAMSM
jgi:hypothetical protein